MSHRHKNAGRHAQLEPEEIDEKECEEDNEVLGWVYLYAITDSGLSNVSSPASRRRALRLMKRNVRRRIRYSAGCTCAKYLPERVSTKSFVVLILENSWSNLFGAQDTFEDYNPQWG